MKDYIKEYNKKCLTCEQYNINDFSSSTGFRCKTWHNFYPFDESCGCYKCDKLRSNNAIDAAVKKRINRGYRHHYILSVLSEIMNLDFDYLTYCQNLRNRLLQSEEGKHIIKYYDNYGVLYAFMIIDEFNTNELEFVKYLNEKVTPILEKLKTTLENNDDNLSIEAFMELLSTFAEYFNYRQGLLVIDSNYDYTPYDLCDNDDFQNICKANKIRSRVKSQM